MIDNLIWFMNNFPLSHIFRFTEITSFQHLRAFQTLAHAKTMCQTHCSEPQPCPFSILFLVLLKTQTLTLTLCVGLLFPQRKFVGSQCGD